ncbi:hypothetical protein CEP54_001147 [Fusarium duplospermum]|uniref:RRM domain-containing protein n=1 Tax=Fusarium duplospermum TaxID=1325734 RepID=A0A428R342_9HYPO|nr:hypothetical protein CEP54_001147 [Fusarium duplospermum]
MYPHKMSANRVPGTGRSGEKSEAHAGVDLLKRMQFDAGLKQWSEKITFDMMSITDEVDDLLFAAHQDDRDVSLFSSEVLIQLNELKSDIVTEVREFGQASKKGAIKLIEMTRRHAPCDELRESSLDLLDDLESRREQISEQVSIIDCLRDTLASVDCMSDKDVENNDEDEESDFEQVVKTTEAPTTMPMSYATLTKLPTVPKLPTTVPEHMRQLGSRDWAQEVVRERGPMVILNNLPNRITCTQVMEGVTGLGGVSNVVVMAEPSPSRNGAFCAMINFNDVKAVDVYIDFFKKKPLFFVDEDGDIHKATMLAYKGATPSNKDSHHKMPGRCLDFNNFHAPAIWASLQMIGIQNIVRVTFNPDTSGDLGELSIELTNAARASLVHVTALKHDLPGFSGVAENISYGLCESDYHPSHIEQRFNNVIPYTGPDHLEKKWNQEPYNSWECQPVEYPRIVSHACYRDFLPGIPEEGLYPATSSTNEDEDKGNGDIYVTLGGYVYSCQRGVVHKLSLAYPIAAVPVRGHELQTLVDLTLGDPGWISFWRDVERQQRNSSLEAYCRMVEHQRLRMEGRIVCPVDCHECHPSLSDSLTPPLRARMYTQTSNDGYVHSDWIRREDDQARRSIPRMTPQMGRIIRYD